ncbi:MAG: PBP1A family penicillin-binding protein [Actinobacteria bacterium]|nr:PBP1A family penicillin-binding protein [Actinomycetota bacterium]
MRFRKRKEQNGKPRRKIRKLRLFTLLMVLGVLGFGAFVFGVVTAIAEEIPKLDPAYQQRISKNGYIYSADGKRVLAVLRGAESRVIVPSQEIAPVMKQAIVAIEDRRFFEHRGVDLRAIFRAVWADVTSGNVVQGGSTITQQFIKNAYVHSAPSISRKLKEAALAWQLEQRWSKDRILTAYLNTIYFGNGAYGIQQASQTYFQHSARALTLPEAALLAGIPRDPTLYDPVANPEEAATRRGLVLRMMYAQGDITADELHTATSAALPAPDSVHLPGTEGPAQYFVNYIKQQLVDRCGSSQVFGGGLRVTTTIDLHLQQLAQLAISKWLTHPGGPSAALVAIDPRNGEVKAMIGGNDFRKSQFNLAVQGERQPGSAFKPFVLATALQDGISPVTEFDSKPVEIFTGDRVWVVHNYEGSYLGRANLTTATTYSDNSIYAQLTDLVGPASVVKTAHDMGITSPLDNFFSIGLGTQAVNPLEMARAFSTFANGGYRIDGAITGNRARAIVSIGGHASGGCSGENKSEANRAISPTTAQVVNSILQTVVTQGTGVRARLADGRQVAGKTGTTQNYGDAWFVGYTPQLVTAVWVGYPDSLKPMLTQFNGTPVAGGTFPALIWKAFTEHALSYLKDPPVTFQPPPDTYGSSALVLNRNGVVAADNGYCQNPKVVVYLPNEAPKKKADCKPNEVQVPNVVGKSIELAKARLSYQPLKAKIVYKPLSPRQRPGIVLRQYPSSGTLSSYDTVTLFLGKALHGIVPRVTGLKLETARTKLEAASLLPRVVREVPQQGGSNRVLFQAPKGGVAASPGMEIRLVVARAVG